MMKLFILLLVLIAIFGFFFWGDLFGPGGKESDVVTVDESLDGGMPEQGGEGDDRAAGRPAGADGNLSNLLNAGRLADALEVLESRRGSGTLSNFDQAAYYRCLSAAKRPEKATAAMNELIARRPLPAEAVGVVLDEIDAMASALKKRTLLGRVSGGFGRLTEAESDRITAIVAELNRSLPRSIEGLFKAESYTIQPNDSLWEICRNYNRRKGLNVEVGLLRCLNGIRGNNIHPGQSISLPGEKVSIRVWKGTWFLCAFLGDAILSAYKVGLGKDDKTPLGVFVIESKLKDPDWNSKKLGDVIQAGDPRNVLGTRWLGFKSNPQHEGYGIHGTRAPESIGRNMSDGCIRLLNEDVEELFELISRGTVVEII